MVYSMFTAYPTTFLGRVFTFLGCPYGLPDKLSPARINYPRTDPRPIIDLLSTCYTITTTMIPSVNTVDTRVNNLFAISQSDWVDESGYIKSYSRKCQNTAIFGRICGMPNRGQIAAIFCQIHAKYMPTCCKASTGRLGVGSVTNL
jgi:hypothetical protein